jgi:hypothetical protein
MLAVCKRKLQTKIFSPKREDIRGDRKKFYNEEIHVF